MILPEHFVLDTGPLLDYFARLYGDQYHSTWLSARISPVTPQHKIWVGGFRSFFEHHKGRLLTSSGVIAEIERHIRKAAREAHYRNLKEFQDHFWTLVQNKLKELKFDEDTQYLIDMSKNILADLGPVDTSIIELAKKHAKSGKRFIVLTTDFGIHKRCMEEQIPVESVEDRIEKFIIEFL
ncbi:MAG: hypothetical protein A2077_03155 [Nitrospirae bacterium GWC2_46_6]|nr:MAG: hypothetical protein A2077_03155 [Nitrospirae bacterium GWC2_46_6]